MRNNYGASASSKKTSRSNNTEALPKGGRTSEPAITSGAATLTVPDNAIEHSDKKPTLNPEDEVRPSNHTGLKRVSARNKILISEGLGITKERFPQLNETVAKVSGIVPGKVDAAGTEFPVTSKVAKLLYSDAARMYLVSRENPVKTSTASTSKTKKASGVSASKYSESLKKTTLSDDGAIVSEAETIAEESPTNSSTNVKKRPLVIAVSTKEDQITHDGSRTPQALNFIVDNRSYAQAASDSFPAPSKDFKINIETSNPAFALEKQDFVKLEATATNKRDSVPSTISAPSSQVAGTDSSAPENSVIAQENSLSEEEIRGKCQQKITVQEDKTRKNIKCNVGERVPCELQVDNEKISEALTNSSGFETKIESCPSEKGIVDVKNGVKNAIKAQVKSVIRSAVTVKHIAEIKDAVTPAAQEDLEGVMITKSASEEKDTARTIEARVEVKSELFATILAKLIDTLIAELKTKIETGGSEIHDDVYEITGDIKADIIKGINLIVTDSFRDRVKNDFAAEAKDVEYPEVTEVFRDDKPEIEVEEMIQDNPEAKITDDTRNQVSTEIEKIDFTGISSESTCEVLSTISSKIDKDQVEDLEKHNSNGRDSIFHRRAEVLDTDSKRSTETLDSFQQESHSSGDSQDLSQAFVTSDSEGTTEALERKESLKSWDSHTYEAKQPSQNALDSFIAENDKTQIGMMFEGAVSDDETLYFSADEIFDLSSGPSIDTPDTTVDSESPEKRKENHKLDWTMTPDNSDDEGVNQSLYGTLGVDEPTYTEGIYHFEPEILLNSQAGANISQAGILFESVENCTSQTLNHKSDSSSTARSDPPSDIDSDGFRLVRCRRRRKLRKPAGDISQKNYNK